MALALSPTLGIPPVCFDRMLAGATLFFTPMTPMAPVPPPMSSSIERFLEDSEPVTGFDFDCSIFVHDAPETFGIYEETNADLQKVALDSLEDLRGGNPDWYEAALTTLLVSSCIGKPEEHERYVQEDSPMADCKANYIDTVLQPGMCETKPNCYWSNENGEAYNGRARYYTDEAAASNKNEVTDYTISVAKYMGTAIACAVLNFVFTLLYFIFRCVCRLRCCGAAPRKTAYHSCEILAPIFFFSVFAIGMATTGYQANHGNGKVGTAIEMTFDTVEHGAADMQHFFHLSKSPLVGIQNTVTDAVGEAMDIIDGTDWVGDEMYAIVGRFQNWNATYAKTLAAIGATDMLNEVLGGLSDTVDPIVKSVDELLETLGSELVNVEDMISEAVGGAVDAIDSMNETVSGFNSDMAAYREANESMKAARQAGVLAIFVVALLLVALGFVGVVSAFTPCKFDDYLEFLLHFTWVFGSLIGTVTFIIGGLCLTLAIGWSDMCSFMDLVKDDFVYYLGSSAGVGLDACYNDVPLIEAFNMTAQLDFAGPIKEQLAGIGEMDIGEQFGAVMQPIIELGETIANITIAKEVKLFSNLTSIGVSLEAQLYSQTEGAWFIETETLEYEGVLYHGYDVSGEGQYVVVEWNDVDDVPAFVMTTMTHPVTGDIVAVPVDPPEVIMVPWPDWDKCCYDDYYSEANIMEPWKDNSLKTVMVCTGTAYARLPDETAVEYMTRLYSAPKCEAVGAGEDAVEVNANILLAYETMFDMLTAASGMLADLGTSAEHCARADVVCPTPELGYDTTILAALENYEGLMGDLVEDFDAMGSSMVGNLVHHVQDFACNMKCGFVAGFMDELQQNWCVDLLAGFLDIALSLVLLASFNIPVCICAAILVNRFRGKWRVSCCGTDFAGADEGGRSVGNGKYAEVSPEEGDKAGEGAPEGDVEMVQQEEEGGGLA